jgi:signal transduction histidine kinase
VLTIRDLTAQLKLEQAEQKSSLLSLLTSSVSHELITPIRCMVTFGNELVSSNLKDKNKRKASLIVNTGKLVLTQIKMLLDRNMLENGNFAPQI